MSCIAGRGEQCHVLQIGESNVMYCWKGRAMSCITDRGEKCHVLQLEESNVMYCR